MPSLPNVRAGNPVVHFGLFCFQQNNKAKLVQIHYGVDNKENVVGYIKTSFKVDKFRET